MIVPSVPGGATEPRPVGKTVVGLLVVAAAVCSSLGGVSLGGADAELAVILVGAAAAILPWLAFDDVRARRAVLLGVFLLELRYWHWRITRTIPLELELGSLMACAYALLEFLQSRGVIRIFGMYTRFRNRTHEADEQLHWHETSPEPVWVDIFIPTYNEKEAVVYRAMVSALAQTYPRVRVWILDDGRRVWLRELSARHGVNYLARDDNRGFKAGNLNHALKVSSALQPPGAFVAVLDCDFVATPAFVERALALMHDPKVAIVQTKQVYFNLDPFQYAFGLGRSLPDWQRFAFEVLNPCKDHFGGVSCCGTSFLARRASLEAIGGIPTESVTEDTLTTLALNEHGMKTVYLNEGLTYGIVAEGLSELLTQCGRWCLGSVQMLHSRRGGARSGRSLRSRWRFGVGVLQWSMFSLGKIVQIALPIAYWFVGRRSFPLQALSEEFVAHFIPLWAFIVIGNAWVSRGANLPILSDARVLLWTPVALQATYRGLTRSSDARFVVTDKGALRGARTIHWRPLKWILLAFALTLAGLAYGYLSPRMAEDRRYDGFALFWSCYNLLSLALAAAVCFEPPQRREEHRFAADESARLHVGVATSSVRVVDISTSGARLATTAPVRPADIVQLELEGVGVLTSDVRRVEAHTVGLRFVHGEASTARLVRKLFSPRYVRPVPKADVLAICYGVLRWVCIGIPRAAWPRPGEPFDASGHERAGQPRVHPQ